jgi:flagellar motor switch protein FliM
VAEQRTGNADITDEEVQALLDRAGPGAQAPGEVRPWDLATTQRISRGRLPTLELLHENAAQHFGGHLSDLLKREVTVTFEGVQAVKAGEYMSALPAPACLELVRARPFPGQALFSIDPQLVFLMVDAFYGGPGRAAARGTERNLTPTENRFARLVVRHMVTDLASAWRPLAALEFEPLKQEHSAHFIDLAAAGETLLVSRFGVALPAGSGAIDFVLPAVAVEPLRETLASTAVVHHATGGTPWAGQLVKALLTAQVEVRAVLAEADISLRDLVGLKPGDVIPIDAPGEATLLAGPVPLYSARFGVSRGRNALTVGVRLPRAGEHR